MDKLVWSRESAISLGLLFGYTRVVPYMKLKGNIFLHCVVPLE